MKSIITEKYNRDSFLRFLRTFLPEDYTQNVVARTYSEREYTRSVTELGKCDSLEVIILEVHHSSSNDARVGIAKETFRLMKDIGYQRALVVFVPEGSDQWRFSLLEITLEWDDLKVTRSYSNPRRHSYLLGKDAHTKTPEQYILAKGPIRAQRVDGKELSAWEDLQRRFSVEALTKEFYDQLYHWYLWAVEPSTGVTFPNLVNTSQDDRDDIAIKIIRLITRLLFVWFIKQKKLVPEQIFDEAQLDKILANFDPQSEKDGKYYNAILQNLFFATLNNEVNKRRFMTDPFQGKSDSFGVKQLFRDSLKASWFKISHDEVIDIFHHVPFMNCGLFECLDKYAKSDIGQENDLFLDGFSSRDSRQDGHFKYRAFVPNRLFFAEEHYETVTVEEKGESKPDTVKVMGLIRLLKLYNFTVQENTPAEVEVSLDPELLGQVFENLLAAYNPETKESARKSTGSFYTPRPIVEYMVNESLVAYLKTKVGPQMEPIYRSLISYEDTPEEMLPVEKKRIAILNALYECKILDPACGSGAFPMGMLQQMVHITRKLDSEFDPYQTKLRIIDNCIYGSDIQPIAMLISKLRFFISLICEQDESRINFNDPENNFGINTLPNLETKFVAANSLLKADIRNYAKDECWEDPQLVILKNELLDIRERHFAAKTQRTKLRLREEDEKKREEIRQYILENSGKPDPVLLQMYEDRIKHLTAERRMYEGENIVEEVVCTQASLFEDAQPQVVRKDVNKIQRDKIDAEIAGLRRSITKEQNKRNPVGFNAAIQQVTNWNPYDQIKAAPFFDPDWMFGVDHGFDIVIGNPPYIRQERLGKDYKDVLISMYHKVGNSTADIYVYFFGLGLSILKKGGTLTFITLNKYLKTQYGKELRNTLANEVTVDKIVDFFELPIFTAATDAAITIINNNRSDLPTKYYPIKTLESLNLDAITNSNDYKDTIKGESEWQFVNKSEMSILEKIALDTISLKDFCHDKIFSGIKTGLNEAFIVKDNATAAYLRDSESKDIIKPYAISTAIKKWGITNNDAYFIATGYDLDIKRNYPTVYKYLHQFEAKLNARGDKGVTSYNLRACAYYADLERPKIIYIHTAKDHQFFLDYDGHYINNSCYMISTESRFLWCFLNSKLFKYFKKVKFVAYGDGQEDGRCKLDYNKMVTIPVKTNIDEAPFRKITDSILAQKKRNSQADVSDLENQIDILVYLLYKLTYDEVRIVDPEIETIISEQDYNKRLAANA